MKHSPKVKKSLKAFALRIESLRIRKSKQQKDICKASGVSSSTYSRLISDDGGGVSIEKLFAVLEELGVLDAIVAAIPEEEISPLQYIKNRNNKPIRIRKSSESKQSKRKENW